MGCIDQAWAIVLLMTCHNAADDEREDGIDCPEKQGSYDIRSGYIRAEALEDCYSPRTSHGNLSGGHVRRDSDQQIVQR